MPAFSGNWGLVASAEHPSLEDENALTIEARDHDEQRFKTLGMGPYAKVLFVIHAERGDDCIRIISARKADRHEVIQYYQGLSYE